MRKSCGIRVVYRIPLIHLEVYMKVSDMHKLAVLNPFHSVVNTFDVKEGNGLLLGVKNDSHIHPSFINQLTSTYAYQLHTVDHMAIGGRAIDLQLVNPITGRYMSGSSSGTAINVFLGMNDIGIGSDGGGSVLAPAMSLNLFGFISYLIDEEHMNHYQKLSTDNILFRPSLGIIASDETKLYACIEKVISLDDKGIDRIIVSNDDETCYSFPVERVVYPDRYGPRQELIEYLNDVLPTIDFMISKEGPVDVEGFGDSVFGHFDDRTLQIQQAAKKGFIRVVNMAHATAITIPTSKLGVSYVGICESKEGKIGLMLEMMRKLVIPQDELIERYFRNPETWFRKGYGENNEI